MHLPIYMIVYNFNGEISHFFIICNEYVKSVDVISEEEGYSQILNGNYEQ